MITQEENYGGKSGETKDIAPQSMATRFSTGCSD
jgi:hypothetical protein